MTICDHCQRPARAHTVNQTHERPGQDMENHLPAVAGAADTGTRYPTPSAGYDLAATGEP